MPRKEINIAELWEESKVPESGYEIDPKTLIEQAARKSPPPKKKWMKCPQCGNLRPYPPDTNKPTTCTFCQRGTRFMGDNVEKPKGTWPTNLKGLV